MKNKEDKFAGFISANTVFGLASKVDECNDYKKLGKRIKVKERLGEIQ